jgi:hypothetical protein
MSLIRTKTQKSVGVWRVKKSRNSIFAASGGLDFQRRRAHHPPLSTYWNVHISRQLFTPGERENERRERIFHYNEGAAGAPL